MFNRLVTVDKNSWGNLNCQALSYADVTDGRLAPRVASGDAGNPRKEEKMVSEPKFSITVKSSYLDRHWGDDFIDYAHYARYVRDAWIGYARELGLDWPRDYVPMVIRGDHTYTSPLRVEEEARVYARQTRIGRTSGTMEFRISEAGTGRTIAILHETAVWVERETGRPVPLPEEWKNAIVSFEGEENVEVGY